MKIICLFAAIAAATMICTTGYSQMPYYLSTSVETYTPLTGATSLNGPTVWDSYNNNYAADMGFTSKIDTARFKTAFLGSENVFVADSSDTSYINGFFLEDADLIDRGTLSGVSASPIRYEIDGSPGSRVFKMEIANAGFHAEYDNYGTQSDFINMQVWVHENTNIIELHYGPSSISNASDYFSIGGMPFIGLIHNLSPNGDGVIYMLSGNPAAPKLDSMVLSGSTPTYMGSPLTNFPPSGTVYRFVPKNLSVKNVAFETTLVYPTSANNEIMVNYDNTDAAWYKVIAITGSNTNISGQLQKGVTHIDVSTLPKGNYFIQLGSSNGKAIRKFVKL